MKTLFFSILLVFFQGAGWATEAISERCPLKNQRPSFWSEEYLSTVQKAKEGGKPLLVAFMGTEWCPWSEKLTRDILSNAEFVHPLKEKFEFVWISCSPTSENRLKIEEFPTLVVVNSATEEEMFKVSYLPLPAKEFASHLEKLLGEYNEVSRALENVALLKVEDLKALYPKAQNLHVEKFKEKILQAGLTKDAGTHFLLEQYAALLEKGKPRKEQVEAMRKKIITRDPKNKEGSLFKVAVLDFQAKIVRLKKKQNPLSVLQPLAEYLKKFGEKDKENAWKVEMMMAQYLFTKNHLAEALKHAKNSLTLAPLEAQPEIVETINFMQNFLK